MTDLKTIFNNHAVFGAGEPLMNYEQFLAAVNEMERIKWEQGYITLQNKINKIGIKVEPHEPGTTNYKIDRENNTIE